MAFVCAGGRRQQRPRRRAGRGGGGGGAGARTPLTVPFTSEPFTNDALITCRSGGRERQRQVAGPAHSAALLCCRRGAAAGRRKQTTHLHGRPVGGVGLLAGGHVDDAGERGVAPQVQVRRVAANVQVAGDGEVLADVLLLGELPVADLRGALDGDGAGRRDGDPRRGGRCCEQQRQRQQQRPAGAARRCSSSAHRRLPEGAETGAAVGGGRSGGADVAAVRVGRGAGAFSRRCEAVCCRARGTPFTAETTGHRRPSGWFRLPNQPAQRSEGGLELSPSLQRPRRCLFRCSSRALAPKAGSRAVSIRLLESGQA